MLINRKNYWLKKIYHKNHNSNRIIKINCRGNSPEKIRWNENLHDWLKVAVRIMLGGRIDRLNYCALSGLVGGYGLVKKAAWLEVNTGGSFFRMAETAGCFLNSLSRNLRTILRSHPRGCLKPV